MARKKSVPAEEQEANMEALGLPEAETAEGLSEAPEGAPEVPCEAGEFPEVLPPDAEGGNVSGPGGEAAPLSEDTGETPAAPPEAGTDAKPVAEPPDGDPLPGPSEIPEPPRPR